MGGGGGGGGRGVAGTNYQLLMLSSNLLKSKTPMYGGGGRGWGWWNQLSTFDAEFKFAKIQNSYVQWGGGGWWNQLSSFVAEFKFALKKIFFAKNLLSFRAKIGMVLFWFLNTEWFAIRSIANHNDTE